MNFNICFFSKNILSASLKLTSYTLEVDLLKDTKEASSSEYSTKGFSTS